jgi:hypothetical protein
MGVVVGVGAGGGAGAGAEANAHGGRRDVRWDGELQDAWQRWSARGVTGLVAAGDAGTAAGAGADEYRRAMK